ncbi:HTH-type transcriptional repressor NsrR [mine drainage metagenome]|uniref:HTH-type transcriptional repressor NsrR n=1 Tax=mine drainage metagenome TaxID=410659 RepID=A0A1J5RCR6_9ZZZZ
MKLSQFTDYSLRLLIYLSEAKGRLVTISEIATHYDISAPHLKKVVTSLSSHKYIRTVRGKHGGIALNKEPEEINLGELIRHQENLKLIDCTACAVPSCKLPMAINEGLRAFLTVFDRKTLRDIL